MYLYHNVLITNHLLPLVNKQMTHAYYRVTRVHVDRSYWQALIYIHHGHEAGHIWVHGYWKYQINECDF